MAATILGWASLALMLCGGVAVFLGMRDVLRFDEATMAGQSMAALGAIPLVLGLVAGIVWLVVK